MNCDSASNKYNGNKNNDHMGILRQGKFLIQNLLHHVSKRNIIPIHVSLSINNVLVSRLQSKVKVLQTPLENLKLHMIFKDFGSSPGPLHTKRLVAGF